MAICPKCKEVIESLLAYSEVVNTFKLEEKGEAYVYGNDNIEGYTSFECPECCEKLFDDEENEAIKFLKDKDELQELVVKKMNEIKNKNGK